AVLVFGVALHPAHRYQSIPFRANSIPLLQPPELPFFL
ncbi:MAG: hypothetical protein AVDCRST_MAG56-6610, partial [uncultured Cytophagales bacterium]